MPSNLSQHKVFTSKEQLGWNCFDIAVEIERLQLIQFALEHKDDENFRRLLAPEIRHAAAITAAYQWCQQELSENGQSKQSPAERIAQLFEIAGALTHPDGIKGIQLQIEKLLTEGEAEPSSDLLHNALPKSMHTKEVFDLFNAYCQAHESMKDAVTACNQAMGSVEGHYLSLQELDNFFEAADNRGRHQEAYNTYSDNRERLFTPHETAFHVYCKRSDIYEQYVKEYYGKNQWFAFQRNLEDEQNTGMIDITARMLGKQIVIYQKNNGEIEEIYKTNNIADSIISIKYLGNNHFIKYNPVATNPNSEIFSKDAIPQTDSHDDDLELPDVENKQTGSSAAGYLQRKTVSDATHGFDYQIHFSMFYAFYYAFEKEIPFTLHMEDLEYGDFDDVVIITEQEVRAHQLKHRLQKGETASIGDFVSRGSKKKKGVTLHWYFDSVYEKLEQLPENNYFYLVTNKKLPKTLNDCLDKSTNAFSDAFFQAEEGPRFFMRNLIIASLLKYSEKHQQTQPIDLNQQQLATFLLNLFKLENYEEYGTEELKKRLHAFFKKHFPEYLGAGKKRHERQRFTPKQTEEFRTTRLSELTNGKIRLTETQNQELVGILSQTKPYGEISLYEIAQADSQAQPKISQFIKRLRLQFDMSHNTELQEEIKSKLKEKFNTTNDAIYLAFFHEFYSWLMSPKAKPLNDSEIKALFGQWHHRYIKLEHLVGFTQLRLAAIKGEIKGKTLPQDEILKEIRELIKPSISNISIVLGDAGTGKSSLIKKLITEDKPIDGELLFVNFDELATVSCDFKHLPSVKMIVIDDAENITQVQQEILNQIIKDKIYTNKIIILLSREKIEIKDCDTHQYELKAFAFSTVAEYFPQLHEIIQNARALPDKAQRLLTTPFYLKILVEHEVNLQTLSQMTSSNGSIETMLLDLAMLSTVESKVQPIHSSIAFSMMQQKKHVLKEIAFKISQSPMEFGLKQAELRTDASGQDTKQLVNGGVLTELTVNSEVRYRFSHALYQQRATEYFIEDALEEAIITDQVNRCICTIIEQFKKYPQIDRILTKLLVEAVRQGNNKHLEDLLSGSYNFLDLNHPIAVGGETLLSYAVKRQNSYAVGCLLTYGAAIAAPSIPPHELFTYNILHKGLVVSKAESYRPGNWYEYKKNSFCDKIREESFSPWKFIFLMGIYNKIADKMPDFHGLVDLENFLTEKKIEEMLHHSCYHLDMALKIQNEEVIKAICKNYLNKRVEFKQSLLHYAAYINNYQLTRILIDLDADVLCVDDEGEIPLFNAIYNSIFDETFTSYVFYGYRIETIPKEYLENLKIVRLLLETMQKKAPDSINHSNIVGWTPLHLAILMRDQELITMLMEYQPKTNIEDVRGNSVEDLLRKVNPYRDYDASDSDDEISSDSYSEGEDSDDSGTDDEKCLSLSRRPRISFRLKIGPKPQTFFVNSTNSTSSESVSKKRQREDDKISSEYEHEADNADKEAKKPKFR